MKIYILRHEDRTHDCSFFSPLTELGLKRSEILANNLEKLDINLVISSPFIRTLQTIRPFLNKCKKQVNLEYGLCEIHNIDIIPKKAVGIQLPEYIAKSFNYKCDYNTIISHTDIKYPECYNDVVLRVKKILYNLIKKYTDKDINILLVTHQSLCCAILEIINNNSKNKINKYDIQNYPKGKICLVFDNDWFYKMIN